MTNLLGKKMASGREAEVYEYSEGKILKLYREPVSQHYVDCECAISAMLVEKGVAVPAAYGTIIMNGRRGVVFEKIDGTTLSTAFRKKPGNFVKYIRMMVKLQLDSHIHADEKVPTLKENLVRKINALDMLSATEKERLTERIGELPEGKCLCHGDIHPSNILINDAGREYLIDWMTARRGDPLADIARTYIIFKCASYPEDRPVMERIVTHLFYGFLLSQYLKSLKLFSGITPAAFQNWIAPVAAARLTEDLSIREKQKLLSMVRNEIR